MSAPPSLENINLTMQGLLRTVSHTGNSDRLYGSTTIVHPYSSVQQPNRRYALTTTCLTTTKCRAVGNREAIAWRSRHVGTPVLNAINPRCVNLFMVADSGCQSTIICLTSPSGLKTRGEDNWPHLQLNEVRHLALLKLQMRVLIKERL